MISLTILVPSYNHEKYVKTAIDSALAVRWDKKEVLVIDDASTDKSWEIIQAFGRRIRAIRHSGNMGAAKTINQGVTLANGEVIMILPSDDYLLEFAAEALVPHFVYQEIEAVSGPYIECWDDYSIIGQRASIIARGTCIKLVRAQIPFDALYKNTIPITTPFKKAAWRRVGGFAEDIPGFGDAEFWSYILRESGHFVVVNRPFCIIRRHANAQSHRILSNFKYDGGAFDRFMERHWQAIEPAGIEAAKKKWLRKGIDVPDNCQITWKLQNNVREMIGAKPMKYAYQYEAKESFDCLEYEVNEEFNRDYCKACDTPEDGFVAPGLILGLSNVTRSPSFFLPRGVAAVHAADDAMWVGRAELNKKITVNWSVLKVEVVRGRLYQTKVCEVSQDGKTILRRNIRDTYVRKAPKGSKVGDAFRSEPILLDEEKVFLFSGGVSNGKPLSNNIHTSLDSAKEVGLSQRAVSGAMFEAYLNELMAVICGKDWWSRGQGLLSVKFIKMVECGESVTAEACVKSLNDTINFDYELVFDVCVRNGVGDKVVVGEAKFIKKMDA
jgi:glycosyltransferase involved in cell wall biosynthesis